MVDRNDMLTWQVVRKGVFYEKPEDAMGHVRVYCGPACVAMIPIFDESEEALERAFKAAESVAEAVNGVTTDTYGLTPKEVSLIRAGKKIQAIKAFRMRTLCGLRESKKMVDAVTEAFNVRVLRDEENEW